MQTSSAQPPDDRLRLNGCHGHTLELLREAGMRILAFHGHDLPVQQTGPHRGAAVRRARRDGFTITYYRSLPGAIFRAPGKWDTRQGSYRDPCQHVLDIELDGLVFGIGWRGDGYIEHDRFERGPWELGLLKAAGMPLEFPFTVEHLIAFPSDKSRWRAPHDMDRMSYTHVLRAPLTFSVVGYSKCVTDYVEQGGRFHDINQAVTKAYGRLREAEGDLYIDDGQTTSFGLRAWSDRRAFHGGTQRGAPGLRYRIGFDSLGLCARLLLAFDCEMYNVRRHPLDPRVIDWKSYQGRRPGAYSRWDLPTTRVKSETESNAA